MAALAVRRTFHNNLVQQTSTKRLHSMSVEGVVCEKDGAVFAEEAMVDVEASPLLESLQGSAGWTASKKHPTESLPSTQDGSSSHEGPPYQEDASQVQASSITCLPSSTENCALAAAHTRLPCKRNDNTGKKESTTTTLSTCGSLSYAATPHIRVVQESAAERHEGL